MSTGTDEPIIDASSTATAQDPCDHRRTLTLPTSSKKGEVPPHLLDETLRQVVRQLRRIITEIRVRPDEPAHELAAELRKVIELAGVEG